MLGSVGGSNTPAARQSFNSTSKPFLKCQGTSNGFKLHTDLLSFQDSDTGGLVELTPCPVVSTSP